MKKIKTASQIQHASQCEANGSFKQAIEILNEIIRLDVKNSEAYAHRGRIKILFLNQVEEGIEDLGEAISLEPSKNIKMELYIIRGYGKLKLMKYEEALDDFKRAIVESKKSKKDLCAAYSGSCIAKKYLGLEQESGEEYDMVCQLKHLNNVFDLLLRGEAHELYKCAVTASEDYRNLLKLKKNFLPASIGLDRTRDVSSISTAHIPTDHTENTSATFSGSLLFTILEEIKTNYQVNQVNAREILNKFEQLLNDYSEYKEEILLNRAEFHFYMTNKSANKTQSQFILENAKKDYKSVLEINCYNEAAAKGLEKVEALLQQIDTPIVSQGLDLG